MIQILADNWEDAWEKLHRAYGPDVESSVNARFGTRAVSFNNRIRVTSNDTAGLDHKIVGYTEYKLSLFKHRYIIPGMKEKIATTLLERMQGDRRLTVISYPFKPDDGAHTQGPCVINMVITMIKIGKRWQIEFDAYIRMGEITRRMLVDFLQFADLINYFMAEVRRIDPNIHFAGASVNAKALYAEPMSLVIAEHLFKDKFHYGTEHWLHRAVQQKIKDFESPTKVIKFKRGNRIRNYVQKMKGSNDD